MIKTIQIAIFFLIAFAICQSNCKRKSKTEDESDGAQAGTLELSTAEVVTEEVTHELKMNGMSEDQVSPIRQGALAIADPESEEAGLWFRLASDESGDPNDPNFVAPAVVKGALRALAATEARLTKLEERGKFAGIIAGAAFTALVSHEYLNELDEDQKKAMPSTLAETGAGEAKAAGFENAYLGDGMGHIFRRLVERISEGGYSDSEVSSLRKSIGKKVMEGLFTKNEVKSIYREKTLEKIVGMCVQAGKEAGVGVTDFQSFLDDCLEAVMPNLKAAGLTKGREIETLVDGIAWAVGSNLDEATDILTPDQVIEAYGNLPKLILADLKGLGFSNDELINMAGNLGEGLMSAADEIGGIQAEYVSTMAQKLNDETIKYFPTLGITTEADLKKATGIFSTRLGYALGNLQDTKFLTEKQIQETNGVVSTTAFEILFDMGQTYGIIDFGRFASSFSEGLVTGLLASGWKLDAINGASNYIKSSFDVALGDEGLSGTDFALYTAQVTNSVSMTLEEMQVMCLEEGGSWEPVSQTCDTPEEFDDMTGVNPPTDVQVQTCDTQGGVLIMGSDSNWVCDVPGDDLTELEEQCVLSGFTYSNSECLTQDGVCELITEAGNCDSESSCTWTGEFNRCRQTSSVVCPLLDQTYCASDADCTWTGSNGCIENTLVTCPVYDVSTCSSDSNCMLASIASEDSVCFDRIVNCSDPEYNTLLTCPIGPCVFAGDSCQKMTDSLCSLAPSEELCHPDNCTWSGSVCTN